MLPAAASEAAGQAQAGPSKVQGVAVVTGHKVSGRLRYSDGKGVPNAEVRCDDNLIATSDLNGNYILQNVSNGAHTIVPGKVQHRFYPERKTITVHNADLPGINSIAAKDKLRISGYVRQPDFTPLPGVQLNFYVNVTLVGQATTDATGFYFADDLPYGRYLVDPEKPGYWFSPNDYDLDLQQGTAKYINFIGSNRYYIAGYVHDVTSTPLEGVTLFFTRAGQPVGSCSSNSAGYYCMTGLTDGVYTISPYKLRLSFTPASREVAINGRNEFWVNFSGYTQYAIRGTLRDVLGQVVPKATIYLSNGGGTATTNQWGMYSKIGLPPGTYTLTPEKMGLGFTPVSKSVTITDADQAGINFNAHGSGKWNQPGGDANRSQFSSIAGLGEVNHVISTALNASSAGVAAVAGDNGVYVTRGGMVCSYSADGDLRWEIASSAHGYFDAVESDGTLLLSSNSLLTAVNPDGTLKWQTPSDVQDLRIAADGRIWCIAEGFIARCDRLGSVTWMSAIEDNSMYLLPQAGFIRYTGGQLVAYTDAGDVVWDYDYEGTLARFAVALDGSVYCRSGYDDWSPHVSLARVAGGGSLDWKIELPASDNYTTVVGADGSVHIVNDANLIKFSSAGVEEWRVACSNSAAGLIVDGEDNAYFYRQGELVSVDVNGAQRWVYAVPGLTEVSSMALADNRTLFCTAEISGSYELMSLSE